ncbi:MAG TPA: hypothetical protein VGC44_03680 [Longimicrobiales bacterium]
MTVLDGLTAPWAQLYSNHTTVAMIVMSLHLLALLIGGGFAVSADRATIRAVGGDRGARAGQLGDLARTHGIVISALVVSFVSGLLLAAADVDVFFVSPLFWAKLGIVFLLLLNGAALRAIENWLQDDLGDEQNWRRLGMVARLSMTLWIAAVIAGVALTDFAG